MFGGRVGLHPFVSKFAIVALLPAESIT